MCLKYWWRTQSQPNLSLLFEIPLAAAAGPSRERRDLHRIQNLMTRPTSAVTATPATHSFDGYPPPERFPALMAEFAEKG